MQDDPTTIFQAQDIIRLFLQRGLSAFVQCNSVKESLPHLIYNTLVNWHAVAILCSVLCSAGSTKYEAGKIFKKMRAPCNMIQKPASY